MSQAEELLNALADAAVANDIPGVSEGYIVVDNNRTIHVPESLKRLGVQHDHNIETVTITCSRFWDGNDMSEMTIYVNYLRPDGVKGQYPATNVIVSEDSITFDWIISKNVTQVNGKLSFLICIVKVNEEGLEEHHWNSEVNQDCYITAGMECTESIVLAYPDVITYLLMKVNGANTDEPEDTPDIPTVSIQPDWDQNDSTQPDYIRDRTHWVESSGATIKWDGNTDGREIIPDSATSAYYKISDTVPDINEVIGGTITYYTPEGVTECSINESMIVTGSDHYSILVNGTAIMHILSITVEGLTTGIYAFQVVEDGTITFYVQKLTYGTPTVHPLDEKFIPDTIARVKDIPQGVSSWNDLTDKPFYDIDETIVVEIPASIDGLETIAMEGTPYFVKLTDKVVDWRTVTSGSFAYTSDGNSVELDISEAKTQTIDVLTCVMFADLFLFFVPAGEHTVEGIAFTGGIWTLVAACGAYDSAVLTLNANGSVPLDEKYIPDTIARVSAIPNLDDVPTPDWSQNDSSKDGYIENRTHWIETTAGLVIRPSTVVDISMEIPLTGYWKTRQLADMNMYLYMEDGKDYTVTFDRNSYVCTCQTYQEVNNGITDDRWLLGNTDLIPTMGLTNPHPNLPFLFVIDKYSNSSGCGWNVYIPGPGPKTTSIEVCEGIKKFHTLDQMFIPDTIARKSDIPTISIQPDWNQNDSTQSDYVKNRTHWEEGSGATIEWDGNTEGLDSFEANGLLFCKVADVCPTTEEVIGGSFEMSTGETYEIISDMIVPGDGCFSLGGAVFVQSETFTLTGTTVTAPSTGCYCGVNPNYGYVSKLTYGSTTVHQIDEKFIPSTIARSANTLPMPPVAAVGQFIVVSAVDENGKITATEAVDAPEATVLPSAEEVAF